MKLIVDQGNSVCKVALYKERVCQEVQTYPTLTEDILITLFERYNIEAAIYSSVAAVEDEALVMLQRFCPRSYELTATTPVPLEVNYKRNTLGGDRLASACGAYSYLGERAEVLVIDAGTALTYERIKAGGYYLGGNISPGLWMRSKALSHFTKRLPLIEELDEQHCCGYGVDTTTAIQQGVMRGFLGEVEAYIRQAKSEASELQILLTGGDAGLLYKYFAEPRVHWVPDLVLLGLLEILNYNMDIDNNNEDRNKDRS